MKKENYIVFFLLLSALLHGCSEEQQTYVPSGEVVKIGFVGPLSGENSGLGMNSLDGARAALQLQPYLLTGDRPEIVVADDKNDPEQTVAAIERLITEEGVSAILLGSSSKAVLSAVDRIDEKKVPAIALLATHPQISKGGYTAQLTFDDVLQGTVAALFVMDEMIVDSVAVFVEPDGVHSSFLAETFSSKFVEAGGEVEIVPYSPDKNALERTLFGLKESEIDFLYLPIHGASVVEIERICRALDYDPEVMLSDGILSRIILDFDSDLSLVEGMMTTDVYSSVLLTKGYGERLLRMFESSFSSPKTTYTALGAEGMSILLGAMDRCGDSGDSECINNKIHSTNGFLGINSNITINTEGKAERPIFINRIVDGKLEFKVMVY